MLECPTGVRVPPGDVDHRPLPFDGLLKVEAGPQQKLPYLQGIEDQEFKPGPDGVSVYDPKAQQAGRLTCGNVPQSVGFIYPESVLVGSIVWEMK